MSTQMQIGGIIIDIPILLEKLTPSTSPIIEPETSIPEPATNVIEKDDKNYVNIFAYLPNHLVEVEQVESAIEITKDIWLQFNGLVNIPTPIPNAPSGTVLCRAFKVVFNSDVPDPQPYPDLYRISFSYAVTADSVNAEALFVQTENLDPETSRGTVTTIRR